MLLDCNWMCVHGDDILKLCGCRISFFFFFKLLDKVKSNIALKSLNVHLNLSKCPCKRIKKLYLNKTTVDRQLFGCQLTRSIYNPAFFFLLLSAKFLKCNFFSHSKLNSAGCYRS